MAELSASGPFARHVLRGPGPFAFAVPTRPLQSGAIEGGMALWLGPDEWLLLTREGTAPVMGDGAHALVDVSHRQVAFTLAGADAALLLAGGVPLDLDAAAFPVGMVSRTVFEKSEIVLWRRGPAEWHVEVARSFAPYVRDLLATIAAANGITLN